MYKCECGKEFENSQSFNAHKSSCKIHFRVKYGSDDRWNLLQKNRAEKIKQTALEKARLKKAEADKQWLEEKHYCEHCGKLMTKKYGSGRFCCQSCANSARKNTGPKGDYICRFCGKHLMTKKSLDRHEYYCDLNPNRPPKVTPHKHKLDPETDLYRIHGDPSNTLVNTIADVNKYMDEHLVCEICGRPVEETVQWDHKNRAKHLCVDHDHETRQFRGALCQLCNRQLGWYEKNKEAISKYLEKDYPLENKSK